MPKDRRAGFTIIELLIVLAVAGLVVGIAAPRFRALTNELESAARETGGFFQLARSKAMTTTSAYRVIVDSDTRLRAESARGCGADEDEWEEDTSVRLNLRERTSLENVAADSTLICFNSRGVGDANPTVRVRQRDGDAWDVEVFVGGSVEVTKVDAA